MSALAMWIIGGILTVVVVPMAIYIWNEERRKNRGIEERVRTQITELKSSILKQVQAELRGIQENASEAEGTAERAHELASKAWGGLEILSRALSIRLSGAPVSDGDGGGGGEGGSADE